MFIWGTFQKELRQEKLDRADDFAGLVCSTVNTIRDKIQNNMVIAVSLDIKNAFNSLSWSSIRWTSERGEFPVYLRRVLDE